MITRPLDLASKLRPEPWSFGALFFVNAGLLVLFFSLFGSKFVLAPGLGVDRLPTVSGADASALASTHVITVTNAGQIITNDGVRKLEELPVWFKAQAASVHAPTLLVRGEASVPNSVMAKISGEAYRAGFHGVIWAAEEPVAVGRQKGP